MVRFHGLYDGKIMVRKTDIFLVFVLQCLFLQTFARPLSNY